MEALQTIYNHSNGRRGVLSSLSDQFTLVSSIYAFESDGLEGNFSSEDSTDVE